jgi:hypothetical protein
MSSSDARSAKRSSSACGCFGRRPAHLRHRRLLRQTRHRLPASPDFQGFVSPTGQQRQRGRASFDGFVRISDPGSSTPRVRPSPIVEVPKVKDPAASAERVRRPRRHRAGAVDETRAPSCSPSIKGDSASGMQFEAQSSRHHCTSSTRGRCCRPPRPPPTRTALRLLQLARERGGGTLVREGTTSTSASRAPEVAISCPRPDIAHPQ